MKYRIKGREFFEPYIQTSNNIYVPTTNIGAKLFAHPMLKFCDLLITKPTEFDQDGNPVIIIKDNGSQSWYFYEGWFERVQEESIVVQRNKKIKNGFQLQFLI